MVGEQRVMLAERPRVQGRFTPVMAAAVLDQVTSLPSLVQEGGHGTGEARLSSIRMDARGDILLKELSSGVDGQNLAPSEEADLPPLEGVTLIDDQRDLALVLVEMLTGACDANVDAAAARQRLVSVNLPARVIDTVVSGLAQDAVKRFRNPTEFAAAFRQVIAETADGFIAGAWEAIGRGDDAMAAVLYEMAEGYAADHPDFPVLAARLEGVGGLGAAFPAASAVPMISASGNAGLDGKTSGVSTSKRPNGNPWVIFLIGAMIGVIGLLAVVAVAFTFG